MQQTTHTLIRPKQMFSSLSREPPDEPLSLWNKAISGTSAPLPADTMATFLHAKMLPLFQPYEPPDCAVLRSDSHGCHRLPRVALSAA
jgi:hypothetical protein